MALPTRSARSGGCGKPINAFAIHCCFFARNVLQLCAPVPILFSRPPLPQTLARARAVIARESHMENVEGHDVQREEANTRALVHLIQRNSMARRHEQPRLQVPPFCAHLHLVRVLPHVGSVHLSSCDLSADDSTVCSAPRRKRQL